MLMMPALPVRNSRVDSIYAAEVFSDDECDRILARTETDRWQTAKTRGQGGSFSTNNSARTTDLHPLAADDHGYPLSKVMQAVSVANSEVWGFELTGIVSDDMPALMRYRADVGGHNDWHTDVGPGLISSRKLGVTVQLTDTAGYEGGDLEFFKSTLSPDQLRKRGMVVIFPSFWLHRVTPVSKGVRTALVGWVHGPSFR